MTPAWAQRREALLSDCLVSPDVFHQIAAPGKFESKRFCSDKKVILRWYVTFTRIFVVLYMKEPSHANSQTALSR
jgi:hypothetical protein